MNKSIERDRKIIEKLGGVKLVSEFTGYKYNTVHNWLTRGISNKAKVEMPGLFLVSDIDSLERLEKKA